MGNWDERPANVKSCLAFVVASQCGVDVKSRTMGNIGHKHIGIYLNGHIWHYLTGHGRVERWKPSRFGNMYPEGNKLYYGLFPGSQ